MIQKSVLLLTLALLLLSAGVFAADSCTNDETFWETAGRLDGFPFSTNPDCAGNFNVTGGNIVGYSMTNVTMGQYNLTPIVANIDNDPYDRNEVILIKNNNVSVYSVNGSRLVYRTSISLDSNVKLMPQVIKYSNADTSSALVVVTGTKIEFLKYNANTNTIYRDYQEIANDYYLTHTGIVSNMVELKCLSADTDVAFAVCAILAKNPSTTNGAILVFAPYVTVDIGATYRPQYALINMSTADFDWDYVTLWNRYLDVNLFQIAWSDSALRYDLFFTDEYGTKVFRQQLDFAGFYGASPLLFNVTGWNGTNGVRVPLNDNFGQTYNIAQCQDAGAVRTYGDIRTFLADFNNDGFEKFCMTRIRPCWNGASHEMNREFMCMNDDGSIADHLGESYQEQSGGGNKGLRLSDAAIFKNPSDTYPSLCQDIQSNYVVTGNWITCLQWNGASFDINTLSANYNPTLQSSSSLVAFRPFYTDSNYYLFWSNVLINATTYPLTLVDTQLFSDTRFVTSKVVVANAGYGSDLELIATHSTDTDTTFISNGISAYSQASDEFVRPTFVADQTRSIKGYYDPACTSSVQTFESIRCSNGNECGYNSNENTAVRLVTDCGTGTLVYGNYSYSNPKVQCTMSSETTPLQINFYLQALGDTTYFSEISTVTMQVRSVECNTNLIDEFEYVSTQAPSGNNIPSGTVVNPVEVPSDFFNQLLGSTTSGWKLFVGLLMIIGAIWGTLQIPAVAKSQHGIWMGLIVGFFTFIFCVFVGLITPFILIAVLVMLTLGIIAWRVFFPSATQ